jgi:hypothetical protein
MRDGVLPTFPDISGPRGLEPTLFPELTRWKRQATQAVVFVHTNLSNTISSDQQKKLLRATSRQPSRASQSARIAAEL